MFGTPTRELTLAQARAAALRAQGFGQRFEHPIDVLRFLGVIQLDSVNVVARTQWLIPFARLGGYDVGALADAIYRQRRGFEYWAHEASWLPIELYRLFEPRRAKRRAEARRWWGDVREQHAELYQQVLDRIRDQGPLTASAFEDPRAERGRWWAWKPAKVVLEDLFDRGDLMCRERTATFERVYDLPERVLPPGLDTSDPGPLEAGRQLLLLSARALGVGTATDLNDYYRLKPDQWKPALKALVDEGALEVVRVEGWRQPAYALPGALDRVGGPPEHRPVLLSPFDNLVWERDRTERLFGFRYRIEIYTPAPKRQYGYYVMPLLAGGALVGRADVKLDRPAGTLRLRRLFLEGGRLADAEAAADDLARFLRAERFEIEAVEERSPAG